MDDKPEERDTDDRRLPYEPPAIIAEEVFETLALACGKSGGGGGKCISNGQS